MTTGKHDDRERRKRRNLLFLAFERIVTGLKKAPPGRGYAVCRDDASKLLPHKSLSRALTEIGPCDCFSRSSFLA
jgi:hypothetical protein